MIFLADDFDALFADAVPIFEPITDSNFINLVHEVDAIFEPITDQSLIEPTTDLSFSDLMRGVDEIFEENCAENYFPDEIEIIRDDILDNSEENGTMLNGGFEDPPLTDYENSNFQDLSEPEPP